MSEARLQSKITKYLRSNGYYVFKIDGYLGAPDLVVMKPGHTFFIETKTATGALQPHQASFHERLQVAGFDVFVIRSMKDLEKVGLKTDVKIIRLT